MGLFSGIKNASYKSKALTYVKKFLDEYSRSNNITSNGNMKLANNLVNATYDQNPSLFGGSYGARPHELILAAMTFTYAINLGEGAEDYKENDIEKVLAYRNVFIDGLFFTLVIIKDTDPSFTKIDHDLLSRCHKRYNDFI